MIRSRVFLFFAAVSIVAGCSKEDSSSEGQEAQIQLLGGANYYEVDSAPTRIEDITFTTTGAWSASVSYTTADTGWITLEPRYGDKAGTYTMAAILKENDLGHTRTAVISVRCGTAQRIKITVSQSCPPRIDTGNLAVTSPKLGTQNGNPLLDHYFCADPTAVEYQGRLYVYGTNDYQQYQESSTNNYDKIKSLVVMSTDDMVNWTFHGVIDVGAVAPWIIASWAPSVICKRQADGSPLFSLYFSNSGWGVGVLEASSPLGPWTSPLQKSLIDGDTEAVKGSGSIFDPGAVIDPDGTAWLSFGGTQGWIARLGEDLHSFDGEPVKVPSQYHFEANELNYIGGSYVYTYNTNWQDHSGWAMGGTVPGPCSMICLRSTDPLDYESWDYVGMYFKNPGYNGFGYGNNHTHMQKFQDNWYLFYHTGMLQGAFDTDGGFRSISVDLIDVDESNVQISECLPTREGVPALKNLSSFDRQTASTAAATQNIVYNATSEAGHMTAAVGSPNLTAGAPETGVVEVRNVDFGSGAGAVRCLLRGGGMFSIRLDSLDGKDIATVTDPGSSWKEETVTLTASVTGIHTLFLVMERGIEVDTWQFTN